MLDCQKEPIPQGQSDALSAFMAKPEFQLLVRLIEARETEKIVAASKKALQSVDHPNYSTLAESELKDAQSYRVCLNVLAEIKNNPTQYLVRVIHQ